MDFSRVLITGGAGFVGSQLALHLQRSGRHQAILAVDNLKRRGSELSLRRLLDGGVRFLHADIRLAADLEDLPEFDLIVDCAAEPSVQAGQTRPGGVIDVNFSGTLHCLELAHRRGAAVLFMSSSRVYPIESLRSLPRRESKSRLEWTVPQTAVAGFSSHGIAEDFSLAGARSFYGMSKLAAELIIQEYVHSYDLRAIINRCGVLAGPWQMGKTDQGFVVHWVASHCFGKPLVYRGYGGAGKQVRDVLHIDDLLELVVRQLDAPHLWDGRAYNVCGGNGCSVSLAELTELCQATTGRSTAVSGVDEAADADVPIFVGDSRRACNDLAWQPARAIPETVNDIFHWVEANRRDLAPIFGS